MGERFQLCAGDGGGHGRRRAGEKAGRSPRLGAENLQIGRELARQGAPALHQAAIEVGDENIAASNGSRQAAPGKPRVTAMTSLRGTRRLACPHRSIIR